MDDQIADVLDNSSVFVKKIKNIDGKPFEPRQSLRMTARGVHKKVTFMLPLNDVEHNFGHSDSPNQQYAKVVDKRKVAFVLPFNDVSPLPRVHSQHQSYANAVSNEQAEQGGAKMDFGATQVDNSAMNATESADQTPKINFRALKSDVSLEGVDVVLPIASVHQVNNRLANTLYGYFLGDRIAYPVVEYFVRTNWKKYGLQKTMMNSNGFFFFKFEDRKGMNNVLEGGPWLIRNKPLFLNTWSPTTTLRKEDIKKVAVWVKLHDVPLAAYTDDGLSMLASKIGSPLLLDSYTASMCSENWGRSSYARTLIEVSAEHGFKEVISMAIPDLDGENYVTEKVKVEYEWTPTRCAHCCVFGHDSGDCPKQVGPTPKPHPKAPIVDGDGYIEVTNRKVGRKSGVPVNTQKPKFEYKPLNYRKMVGNTSSSTNMKGGKGSIQTHNPFSALNSGTNRTMGQHSSEDLDDDDVEVVYDETLGVRVPEKQGASTSTTKVSNG